MPRGYVMQLFHNLLAILLIDVVFSAPPALLHFLIEPSDQYYRGSRPWWQHLMQWRLSGLHTSNPEEQGHVSPQSTA
jgi:hypothetical protein